jgi:hypothetical protein
VEVLPEFVPEAPVLLEPPVDGAAVVVACTGWVEGLPGRGSAALVSVTGYVAWAAGRAGEDVAPGAGALCWDDEEEPSPSGELPVRSVMVVTESSDRAAELLFWAWDWRDATVTPPPNRAKAVATPARRRFFFHRAVCRRRAARPRCRVGATESGPSSGSAGSSSSAAGVAAGVNSGGSGAGM